MISTVVLTQAGLVAGIVGVIVLGFSNKTGVISKAGSVIFTGLDPMAPVENNIECVETSHWRNRHLAPVGWGLLGLSFFMQFLATFL